MQQQTNTQLIKFYDYAAHTGRIKTGQTIGTCLLRHVIIFCTHLSPKWYHKKTVDYHYDTFYIHPQKSKQIVLYFKNRTIVFAGFILPIA